MSANGKRDRFTRKDLLAVADSISLSRPDAIIDEVVTAVSNWPDYAAQAGVREPVVRDISSHQRTDI